MTEKTVDEQLAFFAERELNPHYKRMFADAQAELTRRQQRLAGAERLLRLSWITPSCDFDLEREVISFLDPDWLGIRTPIRTPNKISEIESLRSRLAEAEGLLRDVADEDDFAADDFDGGILPSDLRDRIDAHLAREQPPMADSLLIEMTTQLPDADMQGWNLMERTETYSQWWRKRP